jgi:hypothetical protein
VPLDFLGLLLFGGLGLGVLCYLHLLGLLVLPLLGVFPPLLGLLLLLLWFWLFILLVLIWFSSCRLCLQ